MKNLLKKILLLVICVLSSYYFVRIPVSAQSTSENKLKVSPSFKVIEFEGNNVIKEQLKITNTYNEDITVVLTPVIIKIENEKTEIIADSGLKNNIIVRSTPIVIKKQSTSITNLEIREPSSFSSNLFPGVKVQQVSTKSPQVGVESALISTFFIENKAEIVAVDLKLQISQIEQYGNKIKVSAEVINNGKRAFTPTGDILIKKGNKRVGAGEVTSQINKLLLPGRSIKFEKEFIIEDEGLNLLEKLGKYEITLNVSPKPYTNNITQTGYITLMPKSAVVTVTLAATIVLALAVIILVALTKLKTKKSK